MIIKKSISIVLLLTTVFSSVFGMHSAVRVVRDPIAARRNCSMDIRKQLNIMTSGADVVSTTLGEVTIKKEIPLGTRYGVCHNYALSELMGIVGMVPNVLKICGISDYYEKDGINILEHFDQVLTPQRGDIALYLWDDKPLTRADQIRHTAIVTDDGRVESKWEIQREVFEHPTLLVPAIYGNMVIYFRPKKIGYDLLRAVKNRLAEKSVKEKYDYDARQWQRQFFDAVIWSPGYNSNYRYLKVYNLLERNMNIQVDACDEKGRTALAYAEESDDKNLIALLSIYIAADNYVKLRVASNPDLYA